MTTPPVTEPLPPAPSPAPPQRVLRRSRTGRVGAGVASGLGQYFGFDPVLFRVLFATSAFFGGAGIIAYLIAWAAIPDEGTVNAPIDRWVGALRRRRVPIWLVAIGAGLLLWLAAFSWWAPGPFFPVLVVVVVLVVAFGRREWQAGAGTDAATDATPVDLTKGEAPGPPVTDPAWVRDVRGWAAEARAAGRVRRRRALPVRLAVLITLAAALITLGTIDAITGIWLPVYFWTTLGIVLVGLLVGLALRRTPWSTVWLLIPALAGTIAFSGTHAGFGDGVGERTWRPTSAPAAEYRLAFGQGTLDLRSLPAQDVPRTIRITAAAGQVRILAPKTLNLTVHANIRLGDVIVDSRRYNHGSGWHAARFGYDRTISPPTGATGAPLTVDVHLADGNITVDHR